MLGRTTLKERLRKKTNPEIVKSIRESMKNENWHHVAKILSSPGKNHVALNLSEIDAKTKEGDTILIPGKVLSKGELSKQLRICAISFSAKALEKIKNSKSKAILISDEIKENSKAQGVKIIR